MTRITPRTCLWPLAGSLVFTFSLSFGLTFRSNDYCYAGTCGESLFSLQARLHVVVWYCWLVISITVLAVRAFHSALRKVLGMRLSQWKIPIVEKQLSLGGVLTLLWIMALYGVVAVVWWHRLDQYFSQRGTEGALRQGNKRLAAVALTGHMADVTMGMVLIPVSRHSALASFFKMPVSTTLAFHSMAAYALFLLVITHGLIYASWVAVFNGLPQTLSRIFPVLNPTYLYAEVWPGERSGLGIWRASLIFTGIFTALIFLLMFLTSLSIVRSRHYNVFYFIHLLGILAVIIICLHASTMFYCTGPGLMMWLLDWAMRLYELWAPSDGNIKALGKGWYLLTVPISRHRLDGCACTSPLAHFYIYHSQSSILELHPFTTVTHLASQRVLAHPATADIIVQFLFRPRERRTQGSLIASFTSKQGFASSLLRMLNIRQTSKAGSQWTGRLASLADHETPGLSTTGAAETIKAEPSKTEPISLHLEGPYFTSADPTKYDMVVCLVAGTGVSGALAISRAFKELGQLRPCAIAACEGTSGICGSIPTEGNVESCSAEPQQEEIKEMEQHRLTRWKKCVVLWSCQESIHVPVQELCELDLVDGLDFRSHLTGNGRKRLDIRKALDEILNESVCTGLTKQDRRTWVYISGPSSFVAAASEACMETTATGVEWYSASWDA